MTKTDTIISTEDQAWLDTTFAEDNPSADIILDRDLLDEITPDVKGGEKYMPQTIVDYGAYEVPSAESSYLKLEDGDNRIRLCSKPMELIMHEIKGTKFSTTPCQGDNCEHCATGNKKKYRYAFIVLSKKDNRPYIYEAPITVFRQIIAFATDPEYGNPEEYDITIKKSGEKPNVTYMLVASPKKAPLSEEESEIITKSGLSLETIYSNRLS